MKISDAGRVAMAGFPKPYVDEHVRESLRLGVAGFILFSRNIESPEQTAELIKEIRALAGDRRLLFAVDQEGGRVQRLREPATLWPPLRMLGNINDAALARQMGESIGRELRAIGFDIDFAPVMDVDSNPDNPIIGDRSFGNKSELVAELGAAFIEGMQSTGLWACAKHFPGHGDTETDSHLELPLIGHDRRRLDCVELPPFRAAIEADVAAVMTAHILVETLDIDRPATMSKRVLSILREDLGFDGVIVTDDLEMKAIAANFSFGEAAFRSAQAGADLILVCHRLEALEETVRSLYDAHLTEKLPPLRLYEMTRRIEKTARRFPPPEPKSLVVVGCEEHQLLAEKIRARGA